MTNRQAFARAAIAALLLTGCVFPASVLAVGEDIEATEEAVEKAVQEAAEKVTEEVVEKAVQEAAEKATEEALEKAVEKVADKAEEKAAEKAELMAKRPDEWRGPTTVHFFLYVIDIDEIDDAKQNFSGNVYVRLRWNDKRLADPGGATRQMPLEEVWNPQVLLINRVGILPAALPQVVEVKPDGTVQYRQRYTGQISQPLDLSAFPMDKHTFTIHFISTAYTADQLEFVPDVAMGGQNIIGGAIARQLSLPDWKMLSHEVLPLAYNPMGDLRMAGFAFRFEAERYRTYYLWQVLLPLAVVVAMSWAPFWVERSNVGVRLGVATSSILTLIALRFVLAGLLPRLPYMTRMDHFTVGITLLLFLALIAVVSTAYLSNNNREAQARTIDLWARAAFPATFLLLMGWFLIG
jgi:hypothetical protein